MDELIPRAVLDGIGVALSPLPIIVAISLLGTRRPFIMSLSFVLGWATHLALLSIVLLAAVHGRQLSGGADLTRPLAVVLLGLGIVLVILAAATWRGRIDHTGRVRHWLGRLDGLSPRTTFLTGLLAVSLNAKNTALTLSTVHGMQSAHAGVGESVAVTALFIVVATAGVGAPLALSVALPRRAGPMLDLWRLLLSQHNRAIGAWALLGAGTLLTISGLLTLRG